MELSRTRFNFGVVKVGYAYRADGIVLSNKTDRCRYRWRIASPNKTVRCVTPRGWLAPRLRVRLVFEFEARQTGSFSFDLHLSGQDGSSWLIRLSAVVLNSIDFANHVRSARRERKPLLSDAIRSVHKLLSNHKEEDSVSSPPPAPSVINDEEEEVATIPSFPASVYDPKTLKMALDPKQLHVQVDPDVSLDDLIARHRQLCERRRLSLEQGGLVTTRHLGRILSAS